MELYNVFQNVAALYGLLQDQISKRLFMARVKFDIDPNFDNMLGLLAASSSIPSVSQERNAWHNKVVSILDSGCKLILYGAGDGGHAFGHMLELEGIPYVAFCDAQKAGKKLRNKPVISPTELLENAEKSYVIITTDRYGKEIYRFLLEKSFPESHILYYYGADLWSERKTQEPYFDFMPFFPNNAAFVDAGSYDGSDIIRFYSLFSKMNPQILAFEPEPNNFLLCKKNIGALGIRNVSYYLAGLDRITGKADFVINADESSYSLGTNAVPMAWNKNREATNVEKVWMYALDDILVKPVGMIKMDIEGAEYDALHGAQNIITRDKPFLAVCVYHRQGDMISIMDYLHRLVPEYRFLLRHYSGTYAETVLYAFEPDMYARSNKTEYPFTVYAGTESP